MSFWDVVSGRTYRWNQMTCEAKDENLKQLRAYIDRKVGEQGEEGRPAFTGLSRLVYTYYTAAEYTICDSLDTGLKPLRKQLVGLSSQGFRYLICAFAAAHILLKLWDDQENAEYWTEMARAACIMSGIDSFALERYLGEWYQCFNGLDDIGEEADGSLAVRLRHKRYEHIAVILGLPVDNMSTLLSTLFWVPHSFGIAAMTSSLLEQPEWQAELDRLLPL